MTHEMAALCNFSNQIGKLSRKEQGLSLKVLACLSDDPRISTFDMNSTLSLTIKTLVENKWIKEVKEPYPWHKYKITRLGKKALINVVLSNL